MKKVVHINLNGSTFQVEDAGYEHLRTYLDQAEKTLASNPDKTEIMKDIEQAIADKCGNEADLENGVVTSEAVTRVIEQIGPVQADDENGDVEGETRTESFDGGRKLYRLPQEGKIAGVCAGLAAYFGTDTTVMRLIFVLLMFPTQGFIMIVYVLLALGMNTAKQSKDIAAAYGRPATAEAIIARVKEAAADKGTVQKIGNVVNTIGLALAKIIKYFAVLLFVSLTTAWAWLVGAILLGGWKFTGQLTSLNGVKQIVFVSAVYAVAALPLYLTARVLNGIGKTDKHVGPYLSSSIVAIVVVAVGIISAYLSVYGDSVKRHVDANGGRLQAGNYSFCIDANKCDPEVREAKTQPAR